MSDLDQLFKSKGYKAFMRKLLSFSISVLILILFSFLLVPSDFPSSLTRSNAPKNSENFGYSAKI